jgi:glycosyltransferase involved in cell wall biosynthesis
MNLFDSNRFSKACVSALSGCDILYERSWLLGFGGLMAARRMRIPIVLEVNGDIFEEYRQQEIQLSGAQWAALYALNGWLFRGVDHVVTVSEPLRRRTIDRWRLDPAKVTTVSNGAEVDLFADREAAPVLKARLGLGDGPVVIFVGSFRPWHGLKILVEAFAQVITAHSTARLLLVGDGPVRSELEARVSELGLSSHVVFTGEVPHPEVAGLLRSADVAVVSPRSSGASLYQSPLKLFEYMAAGKAVVAPATPNIEQVATHKVNAYLVPPEDPVALGQAVIELLRNAQLRSALGQTARQHALDRHSWSHTTSELESIMVSLLRKPGSREKGLAHR